MNTNEIEQLRAELAQARCAIGLARKKALRDAAEAWTEHFSAADAWGAGWLIDRANWEPVVGAPSTSNEEANRVIGAVCDRGHWTTDELLKALGYSDG